MWGLLTVGCLCWLSLLAATDEKDALTKGEGLGSTGLMGGNQ